ncbi:hypothetical protein UA08_08704 [Talaromyces atroroseus]|uniref:Uncharacterized protein n=1 Tax=Talaromyces atroroseus TaxID=1441469 RepID=A0A225ARE9_TALAT|nr:hypothetical protein UA08_08704 [Talaromyces atroroseus]OKL56027.1 hypothetical protein UA08_08704 [Talaromyces atroroseus]
MPVYKVHGFQWPRGGIPSIRVFIVLENLDDAAAEYVQQKRTSNLILNALKKNHPQAAQYLPDLQLIEQYDPLDMTDTAVSQPYAFVADSVTMLPETARPVHGLSVSIDQHLLDDAFSPERRAALAEVRDAVAPGQKIGWWIVYNGDPERYYPGMEDNDNLDAEAAGDDVDVSHSDIASFQSSETGKSSPFVPPESPKTPGLKKKRSFWRRKA